MKNPVDPEKARGVLEAAARQITEDDLRGLVRRLRDLGAALARVPRRLGRLVRQARLLGGMVLDYRRGTYRRLPLATLAMAAAALLYFFNPLDLVPDVLPGIGFIDDALVLSLAVKALRKDLRAYVDWKGLDPSDVF
ncbi:MAG TPA: DUF1232 domain-containing protein [Planctomycetota bacterium]|nr:DUF1232 domain-containing protein [Planctomycetota bacterium]